MIEEKWKEEEEGSRLENMFAADKNFSFVRQLVEEQTELEYIFS